MTPPSEYHSQGLVVMLLVMVAAAYVAGAATANAYGNTNRDANGTA